RAGRSLPRSRKSRSRRRSSRAALGSLHKPRARRVCCCRAISNQFYRERSPVGASRPRGAGQRLTMQMLQAPPPGNSRSSAAWAKQEGEALSWSSVMSRYVSVFLPHLPIERLKRERAESGEAPLPDDRPFALVGSEERGLVLTALNEASLNEGLSEGFGLADDGLWLDVTGVPHLFGGEAALLADMAARLTRAGFSARLTVAETLGGAHALARYAASSPTIVSHGKIGEALHALPVEALRLEPEIALLLRRLGLKR